MEQWINRISVLALAFSLVVSFFVFFGTETLASWNGTAATAFASGNGTQANPYVINTVSQMGYFVNQMENGVTYEGLYIKLGKNLDLTGDSWTYDNVNAKFSGHFDGQCYTITTSDTLLPDIGSTGVVQKLNLQGTNMRSDSILCIDNLGLIQLCSVRGTVPAEGSGGSHVGLICEANYSGGIVRWCGAVGSASARGNDTDAYAGMVGENQGTIDGCFAAITTSASASGKYNDPYRHPLGNGQWGGSQTILNSYYDKTLYTLANTYGTGLTTDVMQSAEFLTMIAGNTLPGTQWVTGSDGYPTLQACGSGTVTFYDWVGKSKITYNNLSNILRFEASESGTMYYTTDGSDPKTSTTRRSTTATYATVALSGDMTVSAVLYSGGKYGSVNRIECIYMPGYGTESSPYQILTKKGLEAVRLDTDACYKLMKDLTFTDDDYAFGGVAAGGWNPIESFSGTFDGAGHQIIGLEGKKGGLVDSNAGTITSLRMVDHRLFREGETGPIANRNLGTITRCYAKSAFTLTSLPSALDDDYYSESGGIAGYNYGNISYCSTEGIVPGRQVTREGIHYIGGIVGDGGDVNNCISKALVVSDDTGSETVNFIYAGGISGGNTDSYNCLSLASFYIDSRINYDCYIGGICGHFANGYANRCVAADLDITEGYDSYLRLYKKAWGPTSSDCYKTSASPRATDYPALDFTSKWMVTDTGMVPQGVMDADGHCFSLQSHAEQTCTAAGRTTVKCDLCGTTKNITIPATGHKEVVDKAVEATCTAPGKTEGKHCQNCNYVITAQKEIAKLPHDYVRGVCKNCKGECPAEVSGKYSANLTWAFHKATATLTITGSGSMEHVFLNNNLPWQEYIHSIEHLSLPEGLTYIGQHIFEGHTMLTSVTIPNNVSKVDSYAFSGCTGLTSVDLGDGCSVGEQTFAGCPIQTLDLGASSVFGPNAFDSDALTSITINGDGAWLDSASFLNCKNLKEVHFTGDAPQYVIAYGIQNATSQASFGDVTWYYDCNQSGWLNSNRYHGETKTWAGYPLVAEKHAEAIDKGTPATCTESGITEGRHCSVCKEILVPQTEIPALGHSFADGACVTCGLTGGECGENFYWILDAEGTLAIHGNGDMPSGAPWRQWSDDIKALWIESGITSITDSAFADCAKLEEAILPEGITSIGYDAFVNCSALKSVILPESLSSIDTQAFHNCTSLSQITIPEKVTTIEPGTFSYCKNLTNVTLPKTLTEIDNTAFSNCSSLTAVVIPDGVTSIGESAFADCTSLKEISLPKNLTVISGGTFSRCTSLTTFVIPEGVTEIGNHAFTGCTGLADITIPNSVVTIGNNTFAECTGLTDICIPEGVTSIGEFAFFECHGLKYAVLPSTLKTVGQRAFGDYYALSHILFRGSSKAGIAIADGNDLLTNATWHYNCDGTEIQWLKNCENRGLFCSVCNGFITREKSESGEHSFTDTTDISCNDCDFIQKLTGIAAVSFPEKKEYAAFIENLDASGGVLRLDYDKGAQTTVDMTADMITGFDNTKLGYQSLTVTYGGFKQYYGVTVVPGTPDTLEITCLPAKTVYMVNEVLDITGLALRGIYPNGSTLDLPVSLAEISSPDMSTPGTKTVTVRVGDASARFEILVQSSCTVECDPATYPESSHNYAANADETQIFTVDGASGLSLTFSDKTFTEFETDYIYVMDGAGTVLAQYSGNQAQNQTITVPGDTVQIRLTSDDGVHKYGYSFASIRATMTYHVFGDWEDAAQAGCGQEGKKVRSCLGLECDYSETEIIPALGHNYGKPAFAWQEDHSCIALFPCSRCGESTSVSCDVTSRTIPAGKDNPGGREYTATVSVDAYIYTDKRTVSAEHTHTTGEQWHSDRDGHWKQCTVCEEKLETGAHVPGDAATEHTSQRCSICGRVLRAPLGLDWILDQDSGSLLWGSGYFAQIVDEYGNTP